ncbi:protein kinase [Coleofasciculus sp. FACHB-64]|uniref:VIT domain-containing protein n=1 Tax=Cyanophyceae TaxID=3028117 RepID=UPI001684D870|nr:MULTISPECIES: VIT domain-containing protein [unclassified Coleofasciculus]MBD1839461.1 protein kinase [Coleofasciculus sp. FACHB-501]MBD2045238.1 protein kinase [Coleofasciculus sp. FACHB-64]
MTTFPPQKSTAHDRRRCYCLNPNCKQPENPGNAAICESCGSQLLLSDRYRAIKPIGQGGMGRTFLAVDISQPSEPRCVIKQFFPQQQGTNNRQKAAELFRQEATRLEVVGKHHQIPELLAYFEQDDHQYLVQQFIDGENLAQELAQKGPFKEVEIRQLLQSLLPVLQFVHSQQMIHRDIKPENIIRNRRDGKLVLVDFGAAKYATETMLGKTGTVIGSAAYTAPEQVKGKAIFASDLYSLGVTCIHLLTQIPPFDLSDTSEDTWVWRHFLKTPVSKQFGSILDKMLQTGTKRRYQSADEVLQDLNGRSLPTTKRNSKKKWLIAGAFLLFGFAGVRYLASPVVEMVTQEIERQASLTEGSLFAIVDGQEQVFPLKHTEVVAKVTGNVSRVEVTQTFENPFNNPLEAVYKFPLPDEAAVDDMEIKVGDRIIRGVIKKREEAKQIYEQAKQEGKTAALLDQERDNIFTQSLANIKPGEKIDVTIRYSESLKFEKGNYEFVFPMVVGPRYSSGNSTNNQGNTNLTDTSQINPPTLPAGSRSGQDIGVTVEIEAGVPVKEVRSPSHQIRTTQDGRIMRVELSKENAIPNKDLILRYQVSSAQTQSTVLSEADERGGHFATYLIPAVEYQSNEIVPKDVVFLMDTSGSQSGPPIEQSKELMRRFINGLNPGDTFNVVDFSDSATQLSPIPLPNTPQNREKALNYINRLDANGGTELFNGIQTVLNFPAAPEGRLRSIVLITDGLIDQDQQAIAEIKKRLKPGNRLYSFGVGPSVNRFLIDRLAEEGRGTSEVVPPRESAQKVVEKFSQQINNPVLTNIEVNWEGSGKAPQIYPIKPPDLFANQPLVLFGRKGDRAKGTLRITGIVAGGKRYEKKLPIEFDGGGNSAIAQLWGRARIKDLMNEIYAGENPNNVKAVTDTALAYRLLSQYTSFVAVTEEVRVDPKKTQQVQVPVETPEGMNAEATSRQNGNVPLLSQAPPPSKALVASKPTASKMPFSQPALVATKPVASKVPFSQPAPSAANSVPLSSPAQPSTQSSAPDPVPEPSQILGNILAVLMLGMYFAWKRLKGLKSTPPRN